MTTLNGIEVPDFTNQDQVAEFVANNSSKVYLSFIEDNGRIERNILLSMNEAENVRRNNNCDEIVIYHCMECLKVDSDLWTDGYCPDCNPSDEDDDEDWED